GAAEVLRQSGYEDACPIATVALEVASTSEPLRQAADRVFESWLRTLTSRFVDAGVGPGGARAGGNAGSGRGAGGVVGRRAARPTP
ncbi:MAG: hypothetical protein PV358_15440, partial [Acidimicrobiales bacterium]|nr:hypothetical protein [Acidimicrobiales bacterium]